MTAMEGQGDLLALLDDKTVPVEAMPDVPLTCPGCGQHSPTSYLAGLNHWIHASDTRDFGQPVCVSMNLRRNHVLYWLRCLSGEYTAPDKKCCHGAMKHHTGRVTRAYELEHLRGDVNYAAQAWPDMKWLPPLLDKHGVTMEEAGIGENEWGANCHRLGCHWATRKQGWATRAAAMQELHNHEKEVHSDQGP